MLQRARQTARKADSSMKSVTALYESICVLMKVRHSTSLSLVAKVALAQKTRCESNAQ